MKFREHVALLRGVNVGGKNRIPMADLREAFTEHGFDQVATYIASGNVLFASRKARSTLERVIEAMLEDRFDTPIVTVVRTHGEMRELVDSAPRGFGGEGYHSDVVFLKHPLIAAEAMRVVELRRGVDQAWPGKGRPLLRPAERSPHPEQDEQDRRDTRVSEDDDPQLVDDHEAARAPRQAHRGLTRHDAWSISR
ncbi:MAG: DUF1697 domain-containing protein [Actinomycetota bacterium]|nr:DUF1697 domain-containing protein [Actinomycetota bacterium]